MKHLLLLSFCISCLACQSRKQTPLFYDSLLGNWTRTNEEAGKVTYEHWEKDSLQHYSGMAFTLAQGDTIFKEDLRIYKSDSHWILEVTAPQEKPVLFKITAQNAAGFAAQSPENSYPKKVEYTLENDQLTAKISGGGPEIIFDFEKMK